MPEKKEDGIPSRIINIIRLLHYVGTGFVVVMTALTVVHAIGRYGFSRPVPGLVEMSSFMLVIIIFFTGAYTEVGKGHTVIGIIVDRLSQRTQAVIDIFVHLLYVAFAILACWQTVVRGLIVREAGSVSTVLGIPHYPFLFVVALGWLLIGAAAALHLIRFLKIAVGRVEQ
ncbi:MAG: TRAP transporter small permease [Peptococcaceae bacterium]|nr:TRAP transporter small permease [Peptococcaceae bacterium]